MEGSAFTMRMKILGDCPKTLPWEDRPADSTSPIWRFSKNPIIGRNATPRSNSIFNSAIVPFGESFAGVFRIDDTARRMNIHRGSSADGIDWKIDSDPIAFSDTKDGLPDSDYKYDPRVIHLEDRYYILWCNGYHGAGIGAGYTTDFRTFHRLENIFPPYNRNGVLFPRKIKGNYAVLHRPSDSGHTPFGDIFYSESPDLTYWGKHRWVMSPRGSDSGWQSTKIGAGAVPVETSEGWLLLYHGVLTSCNGFVYSMGAALLDLDQPWKVRARGRHFLLAPHMGYECVGDTPNVVFPCASLQNPSTGRIAIYYGGADTCVNLAFGKIDEIVDFIRQDSIA
jgi:beta-1,4-mannooligosaccharide/beta-1,4-mannosyl-N-acetylglucosamine phosphorylase